ncbi:hypothetical protein [Pseudomonas chlororaphis]|uniref:Uncharacterized protein n=1 Tax=Pseudomonas chlororaphis TaxID=587753 RepID=A0A1Q8EPS4_9PSED|nr:hypothetical protein [Pseudomonas chlororaphis]OLF53803.1 hypothetical protein BTN82_15150 [Pseudomonas chlororaphis]
MAAENIERFNILVGAIFAKLYESFPVPLALDSSGFVNELIIGERAPGEENMLRREDGVFLLATITWLGNHGYIRHGILHPNGGLECVLTAQTLSVLSAVPESLEVKGPSMGEQLVTSAKEGMTSKVKELASDFLNKAVTYGAKAAIDFANS